MAKEMDLVPAGRTGSLFKITEEEWEFKGDAEHLKGLASTVKTRNLSWFGHVCK